VHQPFPPLFDDFLFSNHNVANEIPKSLLCKQTGIECMVEDNLDFAMDLSQHHLPCFLLDNPRNQHHLHQNSHIIRVKSRNDIDLSLLP
jgi:hypothetical protein